MKEITQGQIVGYLEKLGIKKGDGLLIHSAVQFLGYPVGGVGIYLSAIQEVVGEKGTIVVPTFNFDFAKGEPYDPGTTPSKGMGVLSEYVRLQPQAKRTSHPMQSLAALGYQAEDLASRDTPSAFDPGSAFERMLELDFKLLLLGAGIEAVSMVHYSEQRAQVPYRYWKEFSGLVRTAQGWERRTYRMYVRDLNLNPILTLKPVEELLQARGEWRSLSLNYGKMSSCCLLDFVKAVDYFLRRDPWSLVINRPLVIER